MSWRKHLVLFSAILFGCAACGSQPDQESSTTPTTNEIVQLPPEALALNGEDQEGTDDNHRQEAEPLPATSQTTPDEASLRAASEALSQAAVDGETILPWLSAACRAQLGLVSDDDPLSSYLAEYQIPTGQIFELTDAMVDGIVGTVVLNDELPFTWAFENGRWVFDECEAVAAPNDFSVAVPATEAGLRMRLEQLEAARSEGALMMYPWLSTECRQRAVELGHTAWTGIAELFPGAAVDYRFVDAEIRLVVPGYAVTSQIDPANPHKVDEERAAEWVHENGNWQYANCFQDGSAPIPAGADTDAPTLDELHSLRLFYSEPMDIVGLWQNPSGAGNPGVSSTIFFEIEHPTTEEDAHQLIGTSFADQLNVKGYSYGGRNGNARSFTGEFEDVHTFSLDENPCGKAEAAVVWPPETSGAPHEIVLTFFVKC